MTVAELIEKLQALPQDARVVVYGGRGSDWEAPCVDVRTDIQVWPTPYKDGDEKIAIPVAVVIS